MRLIEEKRLMVAELIILSFVVLSGIAIQYCTNASEEYKSKLLDLQSALSNTESVRISQKVSSLRYLLAATTNANVKVGVDRLEGLEQTDPQLKEIADDYLAGNISRMEYFNRLSVRHNDKALELGDRYERLQKAQRELLASRPVWSSMLYPLFAVQFVAILIAVFVYTYLYKSISARLR